MSGKAPKILIHFGKAYDRIYGYALTVGWNLIQDAPEGSTPYRNGFVIWFAWPLIKINP